MSDVAERIDSLFTAELQVEQGRGDQPAELLRVNRCQKWKRNKEFEGLNESLV